MIRTSLSIWLVPCLMLCSVVVTGCQEPPPEKPKVDPNAPPPEPTPEEIYNEMRNAIAVLWRPIGNESSISIAEKDRAVEAMRGLKQRYATKENGQIAMNRLKADLGQLINTSRDSRQYRVTHGGIECYNIIDPGSGRYDKLFQRIRLYMARPVVRVTGFMEVNGVPNVFVLVQTKDENFEFAEELDYTVPVGELFHEDKLRVTEIIGDQDQIEVEYLPTGDVWVVEGPAGLKRRRVEEQLGETS